MTNSFPVTEVIVNQLQAAFMGSYTFIIPALAVLIVVKWLRYAIDSDSKGKKATVGDYKRWKKEQNRNSRRWRG